MLSISRTENEVKKARVVSHHLSRCGSLLKVRKHLAPLKKAEKPKKITNDVLLEILDMARNYIATSVIARKYHVRSRVIVQEIKAARIDRTKKKCTGCNEIKREKRFTAVPDLAEGRRNKCIDCMKIYKMGVAVRSTEDQCPSSVNKKIDNATINKIIAMSDYASTIKEIATACSVSESTVVRYLNHAGIDKFKQRSNAKTKVDHLLTKGDFKTFRSIKLECDCSATYVGERAKILGIPERYRKKGRS